MRSKVTLTRSVSEGRKSQSLADAPGYDPVLTKVSFSSARSITSILQFERQESSGIELECPNGTSPAPETQNGLRKFAPPQAILR